MVKLEFLFDSVWCIKTLLTMYAGMLQYDSYDGGSEFASHTLLHHIASKKISGLKKQIQTWIQQFTSKSINGLSVQ